jgi:hypothetical protein
MIMHARVCFRAPVCVRVCDGPSVGYRRRLLWNSFVFLPMVGAIIISS